MRDFGPSFADAVRAAKVNMEALLPFWPMVPTDKEGNREWREWLDRCAADECDRGLILQACKRDLAFFVGSFLTIKQESPTPEDLPFIPWPKQVAYIELLVETRRLVETDKTGRERGDTLAEKPREVGWSWLNLAEGLQFLLFVPGSTGLIGSRVEGDVDAAGSSKSLFWKLDYFIEHLPDWMVPQEYWSQQGKPTPNRKFRTSSSGRIKLHMPGRGTLLGGATHANFGRSGRYVWMLLDEFAHVDRGQPGMGDRIWTATTKTCRLRRVVSTPAGRGNKFASLRFSEDASVRRFSVDWFDDPAKTVGLFSLTVPMAIGPVTLNPGDPWSPWMEATRASDDNDPLFAQEMLKSYEGVGGSFYENMLPIIKVQQVKTPLWTGKLIPAPDGKPKIIGLQDDPNGFFHCWEMWTRDEEGYHWPMGQYVMGIDVASGSRNEENRGASNSVVAVGRIEGDKTVKVAQYMTSGMFPHVFARMVYSIGHAFRWSHYLPALAIWEAQGPGEFMGHVLIRELGYSNYYQQQRSKNASTPGFYMHTHRDGSGKATGSKVNVFNLHKALIAAGLYAEPSFETFREMEQYKYTEDAGPEHHAVKGSLDPGLGRANHGDSVIATVLMVWAAQEYREKIAQPVEAEPPKGSIAYYQRQKRRQLANVWR